MKVELIKQVFNDSKGYKIKSIDWCCDELKNNPLINLEDKYCKGKDKNDVPAVMIKSTEMVMLYDEEWEEDVYYLIKVCPFCGEPIEISVVREEDVSEQYNNFEKQRDELYLKHSMTDSKKEEKELRYKITELDRKIEWFHYLQTYKENV